MKSRFLSERNLKFLLDEVFDLSALAAHQYYERHNKKLFDLILKETIQFSKKRLRPILSDMDQKAPELREGEVIVHPQVSDIMRQIGEGGWIRAGFPEAYDGEQLPILFVSVCRFIFWAANYSAGTFTDLTAGAARLITSFGSPQLIDTYVPSLLAGKWQGTMALTEPQAGSSLSEIATSAKEVSKGIYSITGEKVFISAGDHNGAENIIHLMLARIEGAPGGTKGISLFLVPKKRIDQDGKLVSNDISVSQLYHKLGYRGCPITQLSIGENRNCLGYLIGEPNQGLSYMFQMMNEARIGVGLGATAIASAAYYASLEYSKSRLQGKSLRPDREKPSQIPIVEHPDVKRMLLFQKSIVEGSLSLLLQTSLYADLELVSSGLEREKYRLLCEILTPIAKSFPSEMGILSVSQGLQCLGGYGYCEDFPLEQYYRDIRIHPIHEGTTGIQGLDLMGRKIMMLNGKAFNFLINEMDRTVILGSKVESLAIYAEKLKLAIADLFEITTDIQLKSQSSDTRAWLSDATLYLEYMGIIVIAWQWLKQGLVADEKLKQVGSLTSKRFYQGKLFACRYFYHYELPKTYGLINRLQDSEQITSTMDPAFFDD